LSKARLEAFSDGVLAILITIMVLELKVPHGGELDALRPLLPVFLAYVLSFVFLGIYWNNHHHLLHGSERINGKIMWANLHLLFWLSLVPFVTAWMGENHRLALPNAVYGVVLLASGVAYLILQRAIIGAHGPTSKIATALANDVKGPLSAVCYALAVGLSFVRTSIAEGLFVFVALLWLVPDKRIEAKLGH
jgi:uncharacterized membrane protein